MKTCTLLNNDSGIAGRIQSRLEVLARDHGSQLRVLQRGQPLEDVVRDIQRRGCDRLIAAGGDGTVCRLLNAAGPNLLDVELAIIPAGTGNDLARSLGIPVGAVDDAWRIAVEGSGEPMDIGRVRCRTTSYFANAATGGFGGKVAVDVAPEDKRRWGPFAYWMTAVSEFTDRREYRINVELDAQTLTLTAYGMGVANGRYVGGGFPMAPTALLNDGLLHVTTIPVLPTMELLAAGLNFALRRDEGTEGVRTYSSSRIRIHAEPELPFSVDGEPTRTIDATFEAVPAAVRVVRGPHPPAFGREAPEGHAAT